MCAVLSAPIVAREVLRWSWQAIGGALLAVLVVLALDREPPYRILSWEPMSARAGQSLEIRASVWRDTERRCSAAFSRYIFDSRGRRFDLGNSETSAELISAMERTSPGRLNVVVSVPDGVAPGRAEMVTVLAYRCNALHYLFPIEVTTRAPFTVEAP